MASKQGYGADLAKYLDKRLDITLNGSRKVAGIMKGYDQFMNIGKLGPQLNIYSSLRMLTHFCSAGQLDRTAQRPREDQRPGNGGDQGQLDHHVAVPG